MLVTLELIDINIIYICHPPHTLFLLSLNVMIASFKSSIYCLHFSGPVQSAQPEPSVHPGSSNCDPDQPDIPAPCSTPAPSTSAPSTSSCVPDHLQGKFKGKVCVDNYTSSKPCLLEFPKFKLWSVSNGKVCVDNYTSSKPCLLEFPVFFLT